MKYNYHIIKFLLGIFVLIIVVGIFSYLEPASLISKLGAQNTYLAVFIFAIIGGVSTFSAAGFYGTLFFLADSGMNPFILAIFSAPGVLIGDFIFWYLGIEGRKLTESEENIHSIKLSKWLAQKPKWSVPVIVYIYTGLTPLPGDLLMFALAFMNYRFKQVVIPILLGNVTLALIVSLSAIYIFN